MPPKPIHPPQNCTMQRASADNAEVSRVFDGNLEIHRHTCSQALYEFPVAIRTYGILSVSLTKINFDPTHMQRLLIYLPNTTGRSGTVRAIMSPANSAVTLSLVRACVGIRIAFSREVKAIADSCAQLIKESRMQASVGQGKVERVG